MVLIRIHTDGSMSTDDVEVALALSRALREVAQPAPAVAPGAPESAPAIDWSKLGEGSGDVEEEPAPAVPAPPPSKARAAKTASPSVKACAFCGAPIEGSKALRNTFCGGSCRNKARAGTPAAKRPAAQRRAVPVTSEPDEAPAPPAKRPRSVDRRSEATKRIEAASRAELDKRVRTLSPAERAAVADELRSRRPRRVEPASPPAAERSAGNVVSF